MAVFPLSLPVMIPEALALHPRLDVAPIIAGDALVAILGERLDQLGHGHTPARDRDAHILANLKLARDYVTRAFDAADLDKDRRDLPRALKKIAQAAALLMAAHDRIVFEYNLDVENAMIAEVLGEDASADADPPTGIAPPPDPELVFDDGEEEPGEAPHGHGYEERV